MFRSVARPVAAVGLPVLALAFAHAAPVAADPAAPDASPSEVGSWVRVSLDAEDPGVSTADHPGADLVEFFVFMQGRESARGIDYGLAIEGGDYIAYKVADDRAWATLPIQDPFPTSIGQAIVGPDCFETPLWIGTLYVRPHEPGGKVVVRPTASAWSQMALLLDCDNLPMYSFVGYGAAVNGRPGPPAVVRGDQAAESDMERRIKAQRARAAEAALQRSLDEAAAADSAEAPADAAP